MKNLCQSIVFLFIGSLLCPMQAQQTIWEGKPAETAVVSPDRRVLIQVFAPEAREIKLEGELVSESTLMSRDSIGLWSYETAPLLPDLYLYTLRVDGVRTLDPGNAYVMRDIGNLFSYVLVDDYASQDVPHGQVETVWMPSARFWNGRRMSVYLPAGYAENKRTRYPVLYLLHGSGGDEQAWLELGRAVQTLDRYTAEGRCRPMIVVMPNGNSSEDAAPGYGRKGNVRPDIPEDERMDGTFEAGFPAIVRYIDSHYRTQADARHRALAGLSMGGYHTYWIALNNPRLFHYIAPFSAVYHWDGMDSPIYQQEHEKQQALWAQQPVVHLYIGKEDFLYEQNRQMRAELDSLGYSYQYTESGGGHQWKNWRHYLQDWLQELFK